MATRQRAGRLLRTQVGIARQIGERGEEYALALKGNQGSMAGSVRKLVEDGGFLEDLKKEGHYRKTVEKARGQTGTRECRITDQISGWLPNRDEREGLRRVGISRNTTKKDGEITLMN